MKYKLGDVAMSNIFKMKISDQKEHVTSVAASLSYNH